MGGNKQSCSWDIDVSVVANCDKDLGFVWAILLIISNLFSSNWQFATNIIPSQKRVLATSFS